MRTSIKNRLKRSNHRSITSVASFSLMLCFVFYCSTASSADSTSKTGTKKPVVIETLVQGSQEQPNVIYITPWQNNEKTVTINEHIQEVTLPQLKPINPKVFKSQLLNKRHR